MVDGLDGFPVLVPGPDVLMTHQAKLLVLTGQETCPEVLIDVCPLFCVPIARNLPSPIQTPFSHLLQ